jgi:hypothetical protein
MLSMKSTAPYVPGGYALPSGQAGRVAADQSRYDSGGHDAYAHLRVHPAPSAEPL